MSERSISASVTSLSPVTRRVSTTATTACETRCICGSLLARLVGDQVELKCRRCKRTMLIPLMGAKAD